MSELRSAAGETVMFEIGPVERDDPPFEIKASIGAQIETVLDHGYSVGNHVRITGHVWNPINGVWVIESIESGTKFTLSGMPTSANGGQTGQVARISPIDLSAADVEMVFMAKRHLQDADALAVVTKGSETPLTGISLNDPSSPRKNLATVTIDPADTDDILDSEDLYFDVQLTEPDGRVTRVDRGIWKIGAAVARA